MSWNVTVITLMPDMYPGPLAHSLVGDAFASGKARLSIVHLRDFGIGVHQKVDDTPYGGGAGMVLKPDVVDGAVTAAMEQQPDSALIYLTPRGEPLTQAHLQEFITAPLILLAGRYESVDERVIAKHKPREISLGDFVLTGGDVPAMAIIEGAVRLIPGVVGDAESLSEESFGTGDYAHLLEYPHYTKPPVWNGMDVPAPLLSGHHANIRAWRLAQARALTADRRPDLLAKTDIKG